MKGGLVVSRTIRLEDRTSLGTVLGGSLAAAIMLILALSSVAHLLDRPTSAEVARAEAAARQQAALDAAWRPWTTAAENLAVVSLCLAVPAGIALAGAVVIRRTGVLSPSSERRTPGGGRPAGARSTVLAVPARPAPPGADAA
jgi:hypothetical protein